MSAGSSHNRPPCFFQSLENIAGENFQALEISSQPNRRLALFSRSRNLAAVEKTSATLLVKMRQPDPGDAWERFCRLYGGAIIRYVTKLGLSETDARDVLQETLVTLTRLMPRFNYRPEYGLFRNFLLTIVHRAASDLFEKQNQRLEESFDDGSPRMKTLIESLVVPETLSIESRTLWQEALLDEAWSSLRNSGKVQPQTLAVFEAYAIRGESAEDVRRKFGVQTNAVHQVRSRIITMLKEEIDNLLAEMESEDVIE